MRNIGKAIKGFAKSATSRGGKRFTADVETGVSCLSHHNVNSNWGFKSAWFIMNELMTSWRAHHWRDKVNESLASRLIVYPAKLPRWQRRFLLLHLRSTWMKIFFLLSRGLNLVSYFIDFHISLHSYIESSWTMKDFAHTSVVAWKRETFFTNSSRR